MAIIKLLDDVIANQIAAGEVVERPASVVKELVENAIDAGADQITVEIKGGGEEFIRVVDNGRGMVPDDLKQCVLRHATSKIRDMSDLDSLSTLGFRGEALPSIASVSQLSIRTRTREAVGATRLSLNGGRDQLLEDCSGPVGTEIRVENLFFNVPARRKFLKKSATEASHIHEWLQRLALCYPRIAIRFLRDGRTVCDYAGTDSLKHRVGVVFGKGYGADLEEVHVPGNLGLYGFVGSPATARGTARHYHIFINGRYVRDRVVMAAVQQAYGLALPKGRHPFVVLKLTLPSLLVDVNVHPAKTEVRFADSRAVHRLVARAVDAVIRAGSHRANGGDQAAVNETAVPSGAPPSPRMGGLDGHRDRILAAMERMAQRRGSGMSLGRTLKQEAGGGNRGRLAPQQQNLGLPRSIPLSQRVPGQVSAPERTADAGGPDFLGMLGQVALFRRERELVVVDRVGAYQSEIQKVWAQGGAQQLASRSIPIRLPVAYLDDDDWRELFAGLYMSLDLLGADSVVLSEAPRCFGDAALVDWFEWVGDRGAPPAQEDALAWLLRRQSELAYTELDAQEIHVMLGASDDLIAAWIHAWTPDELIKSGLL
ncbi:MAG: DNA mismatch repair endonuclease MutL [Bradymonadia bacterium]